LFGCAAIFGDVIVSENSSFMLVIFTAISVQIIGFIISGKVSNSEAQKVQFREFVNDENVNEDNFRSFFEKSLIPFFQIELNGKIKFANSSLWELLGLNSVEEQNEINFFDDVIKNDKIKTHLVKKLESKGRVENYRFKFVRGDKSEEVFILDCQSKKNEDKLYIEGSVKNITQQYLSNKALQKEIDELKQSKRQGPKIIPSFNDPDTKKTNIISKMGHELRTPMNSVLGFLTLIENGLFENEDELKEFSHSAKLSAESLLSLINDVVEISKIQDGTVDFVNTEFDIKNEIKVISSNLKPQMDLKNISLNVKIAEEVPEKIITDPTKYSQVVTNLIRNAINNTEEGEIELLITKSQNQHGKESIITKVIDNSEELEDEELLKLINYSTDNKNDGSKVTAGILHIMIARELTKLLGGEFRAKSELGNGTEFSFEIEIEKFAKQKDDNSKIKVVGNVNVGSRPTLLLVEDNPISRKVEQKLLQEAGYEVHCVETGEDAIENVRSGKYNLVLMDIELKDMNGLEATKKIRELDDKINGIPIIAVTAHSSMKDREKCLLAGMNDYISKPINITFLKMTIDQWLKTAKQKSD
jgi:PAS domain S-box-containing protein